MQFLSLKTSHVELTQASGSFVKSVDFVERQYIEHTQNYDIYVKMILKRLLK